LSPLGWCHPPERLARAAVELGSDRVELLLGDPAKIAALGEVLAQQAVGVLVAAPLPRTARIAEVHLHAAVDSEPGNRAYSAISLP